MQDTACANRVNGRFQKNAIINNTSKIAYIMVLYNMSVRSTGQYLFGNEFPKV